MPSSPTTAIHIQSQFFFVKPSEQQHHHQQLNSHTQQHFSTIYKSSVHFSATNHINSGDQLLFWETGTMTDRCYDCKIASDEHASDILPSCVTCEKKFHGQCVSETMDQHFVEIFVACPNLTWRCDFSVIMITES
jgi:hypothetical protein